MVRTGAWRKALSAPGHSMRSKRRRTACAGSHSRCRQTRRISSMASSRSQGLAQPRDFMAPVAAFEETGKCEVVAKFMGGLWASAFEHSPLDIVAWHGKYVPYKYELAHFMAINTVSFDHPDPSIFTVLTS